MGKSKNQMAKEEAIENLPEDLAVRKEYDRLYEIFKKLPQKQLSLALKIISRAAFMAVELSKLERQISAEGCVSEYQNGANQFGTKKSPEVETYNTMVKNYAAVMKQLTDMLPEPEKGEVHDDGFAAFVGKRG